MQDIFNGTKNMVVESPEGRISETARTADVDKPHITFYKEGAVSSVLTAPLGKVNMDTHEVVVWGGVTVVNQDSATLTTERLRYNPVNQHLVSDDPVTLIKKDSVTNGQGLDAEPDLSRVKIGRQKVRIKSRD
jgi:LPS export ABC transporter protein LptC